MATKKQKHTAALNKRAHFLASEAERHRLQLEKAHEKRERLDRQAAAEVRAQAAKRAAKLLIKAADNSLANAGSS